jgi:2'-5' RNA ligase
MREPAAATRRLFFAFWPDADTRGDLEHACRKAVRGSGGRPVPADKLHATLAFLGSVPETRLPEIRAVAVGLPAAPFELVFDGVEFWPKPQVLVAVCGQQPPAAAALERLLWSRLAPLGMAADPRPFRAHVTLARKVRKPAPGLGMRPVRWPVGEVSLVQSVTDPAGARYEVLDRWALDSDAIDLPGSPVDPPGAADWPQR